MVAEVFAAVDNLEKKINGTPSQQKEANDMEDFNPKDKVKEGVDILTMDVSKDPRKSESSLEMILISLCSCFNMKPKQAAALLTNNNQYLLHSVVKGLKGKYEPIIAWFKMVAGLCREFEHIVNLESQVDENASKMTMVLNTFKTGLFSHNQVVVMWCSRALEKFGGKLHEGTLGKKAYEWFVNI